MDETTVRMNDGKHKTWQHQDHTIFAPKNEPQNLQCEVFGAISSPGVLSQPLFMVTHTTDGHEFITFLQYILDSRIDRFNERKIVLVLDQHPAHFGVDSGARAFLTSHFRVVVLPPATSWMNSQETVFGVMKQKLKKKFSRIPEQVTDLARFQAQLITLLSEVSDELADQKLFWANLQELHQIIKECSRRLGVDEGII